MGTESHIPNCFEDTIAKNSSITTISWLRQIDTLDGDERKCSTVQDVIRCNKDTRDNEERCESESLLCIIVSQCTQVNKGKPVQGLT